MNQGEWVVKWEYLVVEEAIDAEEMRRIGADEWELVSVVSPGHFVLHYFFKRALEV